MRDALTLDDLFLDPEQRSVEPRAGQIGYCRATIKGVDEAKRQIHFLCSNGEVDRYGERVLPEAFKDSLDSFMLNPIFPAGHVYIGKSGEPTVIGHWVKVWITQGSAGGLEGIAEFDDTDPLAIRYWNLYRKGHMKAVSVGFIAQAWQMQPEEIEGQTRNVRVFTRVELLEISAVAIPANRAARIRAAGHAIGLAGGTGAGGGGGDSNDIQTLIERTVKAAVSAAMKEKHSAGSSCPTHASHDAGFDVRDNFSYGLDEEGITGGDDQGAAPDPASDSEGDDDSQLKDALLRAIETIGA